MSGVLRSLRVARGEKVISNTGQPVQLIRPLDFLVITDHAEMMGLAPAIHESNPKLLADPRCPRWNLHRASGPACRVGTSGRSTAGDR